VPVNKEKPWSMDENCWSRSIEGGLLEDPAYHPPERSISGPYLHNKRPILRKKTDDFNSKTASPKH